MDANTSASAARWDTRTVILSMSLTVLALDQLTKAITLASIPLHRRIPIIDGFLALTYVRNRGMAFGLFNSIEGAWLRWVLVGVALGAVAIIWSYARHERAHLTVALAFGAILGGALGNLLDRLRYGYVVDFILAHWGQREWPAFNLADTAITMGGIALFLTLARERDQPEPEHLPGHSPAEPPVAVRDDS